MNLADNPLAISVAMYSTSQQEFLRLLPNMNLLEEQQADAETCSHCQKAGGDALGQCGAANEQHQAELECQVGNIRECDACYRLLRAQFAQVEKVQAGQGNGVHIGQPGNQRHCIQALAARYVGQPRRAQQHYHIH